MKIFSWFAITALIVISAAAMALTADNSLSARGDAGWGNTDWGDTGWRNTDWKSSGWGSSDWGNTGWEKTAPNPQGDKYDGKLIKVTLGVKKPDGFCAMVVTWAKSSEDAVSAVARDCQGCMINNLGDIGPAGTDAENIETFCK